jgi:solute carrier family 30 (zinc transporter), member 1
LNAVANAQVVKKTGAILMETVPTGVNPQDVKHDLEQVEGVLSIHELHIWRLNQRKAIASAHVVVSNKFLENFVDLAKVLNECFHAYGIHSATLQPELADEEFVEEEIDGEARRESTAPLRRRRSTMARPVCRITCGTTTCEALTCCN